MTVSVTIRVVGDASRASTSSTFVRGEQRLPDHPDDAGHFRQPVVLDQAIEAVLGLERIAYRGGAEADPTDRPRPGFMRKGALGKDCLVPAVEGTQSEMDDPDFRVQRDHGRQHHL